MGWISSIRLGIGVLGALLALSGALLGALGRLLGRSWGVLRLSWDAFGHHIGTTFADKGPPGALFEAFRRLVGGSFSGVQGQKRYPYLC